MVFVRVREGGGGAFGLGKLADRTGDRCTVEYFDAPTSTPVVEEFEARALEPATIPGQTRAYHFNTTTHAWEIGRVLDDHGDSILVQFPNGVTRHLPVDEVFVRWGRPIADPTPFLAGKINESPRFSDGRGAFVRSQVAQRGAALGMSALLSSAIELEAHQVEVVRRVLQDPVQRYLLADEVGLGKTIEAGVLIRQCVLDARGEVTVVVMVPAVLVSQWRTELSNRFFLGSHLDKAVHVLAHEDEAGLARRLATASMLVIDEAHHLAASESPARREVYARLAEAAPSVERILLLSATPALHNERGFLEMLHLLDPQAYPLDGEEAFRRKVRERQAVAEIVANLTPQNALYLDYTLDQLAELFADDPLLQEHAMALRAVLDEMPAEDEPDLIEAVGRVHAHVSEVYRLHRRILRHRRRNVVGLTPDRAGAKAITYTSADRAVLTEALEVWRSDLDDSARALARYHEVLDRAAQYAAGPAAALEAAPADLDQVGRLLLRPGVFDDRLDALIAALPDPLAVGAKVVVFCTDPETADRLAAEIPSRLAVPVHRHSLRDPAWRAFSDEPAGAILICDRTAEEGLNLQGRRRVIVHFDLPLSPNRIEQRLGRADRYGAGEPVPSLVLVCRDDPLESAWFTYLDTALQVFDRSVASLQYLIDNILRTLRPALLTDGVEALIDLTAAGQGEGGVIDQEVRAIDQQDALDSLGAPPIDLVDALSDVDGDTGAIAEVTAGWVEAMLQFRRAPFSPGRYPSGQGQPFRYLYATDNRRTLIPLATFMDHCAGALDLGATPKGARVVPTIPYVFSRRTALTRQVRSDGVGLLRYGDPFISGVMAFTQADDRGRSSAMWRYEPSYISESTADIFLRFDFIVEADAASALEVLRSHGFSNAAIAAIRRRADMALPPFFETVWLSQDLQAVEDPDRLQLLGRAYSPDGTADGGRDVNLNAQRWRRLERLDLPLLESWSPLCLKARATAEDALRSRTGFSDTVTQAERRAGEVEHGRLGQLRARARDAGPEAAATVELRLEEALSTALRAGVRAPHVRVDSVGAVFLSGDRRATETLAGDA